MMIGGLFRVVLFLAPILAFLFFYIASKQEEQKQDMKVEATEFDRNFAQMNAQMSKNEEKEKWQNIANEKSIELEKHKAKQIEIANKNEAIIKEIEKEIENFDEKEFKKLHSIQN